MATRKIVPVKKSSATQKTKMKRGFKQWAKSPAGRKYAAIKKDPRRYAMHLMARVKKILGWIKKLTSSKTKDPLKQKKITNHRLRIRSLMEHIQKLKKRATAK